MKNRIALLFPYFGQLPDTFDFWLKTISVNKCVDIYIFTDQTIEASYYENVFVENMSFDDFAEKVQSAFDFEISLKRPYKICDFRPAFGNIFASLLESYDFWGYGDMDVIWGSFENFINDNLLEKYDRISQFGHLSLYRNCEEMNNLFLKPLNDELPYLNVFTTEENCAFDEWWNGNGIENITQFYNINEFRELSIADVSRIYRKRSMCFKFEMNCLTLPEDTERVFFYDSGHLFSLLINNKNELISSQEVIYAHFQKRKLSAADRQEGKCFYIVPNKIMYASLDDVMNYLKSGEYAENYKNELKKFKSFREKYPDVF